MRHPTSLLALAAVLASTSVVAQGETMHAELATPLAGSRDVAIDGRLWSCRGNACTARGTDPRPAIACRKLSRKLGPVSRFVTAQGELDPAGLATCNQDHD